MQEIDRRTFAFGSGLLALGCARSAFSQTAALTRKVSVSSVSWIHGAALPDLSLADGIKALNTASWPLKVMVGLVGTSNNAPADVLPIDFQTKRDYRAFTMFDLGVNGNIERSIIDGGFTPPIDKSKLPALVRRFVPDDTNYYPGEYSPISMIRKGVLSEATTIDKPEGYEILVSSIIKFRAGKHTDELGVNKAESPYHVPWVWCEHALFRKGNSLRLIANGSRFPSHAWYLDGKKVLELRQASVTVSANEIAFTKGASANVPQPPASDDKQKGRIDNHAYTIPAKDAAPISFDIILT